MRLFKKTFGICIVLLLTFNSGCTKDSSTNPSDSTPGANTVTYVDNLIIPNNNPNITNTRVDSNSITFTIVNGVSPVTTGDILLSTNGDGYLRKVLTTSLSGNTVIATTENASMEEAIKDGHYDSTFVLQPVQGSLNKAFDHNERIDINGKKGRLIITSDNPLAKLATTNSDWSMTFPNFKYTITDNQNYKFEIVTDAFVISIKNDLSMQTDFTLLTGLKKLSIKNTKSISLEFVNAKIVLNGGKIGKDSKKYPLTPDIPFGGFPVLGIPFIASLAIDFGIEYELTANGGFQSTNPIKLTYSDDAGFLYQKNQGLSTSWNPNVTMSGSLTFKPTSGFKGELRAFIKPQLKLKAVGQAGPTFFAKGFEYNKVTLSPLECELGWGLSGGIGAEISLFSKLIFYQELTLAEKRWPFLKKSYANTAPSIPAPISPLNNATSVSLAPTLSWSCTDPDGDALVYDVYFGTLNPPTTKVGSNQSATTLARSGLSNSTNYYWSVNAIDEYGSSTSGPVWSFTTIVAANNPPSVITTVITAVTTNSASGGGNVTSQGSAIVTTRGVCWSTSQNPTTTDSKTSDGSGTGSFTSSITGLTAATTYYVRAYATNSTGTSYGSQVNFTTSAGSGTAPTVTTTAITGVTTNSATGGGNVTSQGSATVTARGVCWSTSQNPTTADSKTSDGSGTGSFTSAITGLSPSTTYYVKAYATNSAGTSYGSQLNFTTGSGGVTQNDPIAYYPFNGNVNDESGNGNNGINNGASLTTDRFGNTGKAYSFNGSNNDIRVPNSNILNFGVGDFSFSLWIFKNADQYNGILSKDNFDNNTIYNGIHFSEWPDISNERNGIGFNTRNTANSLEAEARYPISNFANATWYHIVGQRKANILYLYVNGILCKTMAEPAPIDVSTNVDMWFGSLHGNQQYLDGKLDDIRIYNRALSATEVDVLYHEGGWTGSGVISQGMVSVDGGTFTAGSTPVTISSFKIDKYEVTYELWTDVRTWALTHGYTDLVAGQNGNKSSETNNPVTNVSWYDVVKWCNARSEKDGLSPVYYTDGTGSTVYKIGQIDINTDAVMWNANGYRLPTETEWEFAARGGTNSQGYTYSGSNTIDNVAWYISNSGRTSHTIGTKSANELGIYDMSGNAWEWCWDWYDNGSGAYPSGSTTDPKGPSTTQSYRLVRGGSFDNYENYCRVDSRNSHDTFPYISNYVVGLRCVQK
ncbi:MAG: hypothetical protein EHM64_09290 [Ignavibacteriae bacterium]|nr:MAG: hypothetical protein EHM64_09290 [Ignavibacteriota bacterium]